MLTFKINDIKPWSRLFLPEDYYFDFEMEKQPTEIRLMNHNTALFGDFRDYGTWGKVILEVHSKVREEISRNMADIIHIRVFLDIKNDVKQSFSRIDTTV